MPVQFGRAKHNEKITIKDCMRYPIWLSAHDDRHDEEWQKPIKNKSDVDTEILRIDNPIIAIRLDGSETYGCAHYDDSKGILYAMAPLDPNEQPGRRSRRTARVKASLQPEASSGNRAPLALRATLGGV